MKKQHKKCRKLPHGLYWRGPVIYMRSQRSGASFNQSCETADPAVAQAKLAARLTQIEGSAAPALWRMGAPPINMRDLFHLDYARAETNENHPGTLEGMRYGYSNLERLIPPSQVGVPTPALLQRYVKARRAEGVGNNTIRKELILYRCGLRLAHAEGRAVRLLTELPRLSLRNTKPGQSGTGRTVPQLRAWLAELQPEPRAAAILYLLTGMRHEEGARLRPEHLQMEAGAHGAVGYLGLTADITKPKRYRRVTLTRLGLIAFHMAVPLDRAHRSAYRGAAERAEVTPYIHDRDLRTAFASLASALGDPYTVHLAMGHGRTTASTYQKQDMDRLAALTRHVEDALGLTPEWLTRAHLCRWQYSRGRQRLAPEGL